MSVERSFFAMPYPGIFRITAPLPFPGLNHVHVYLVEGPGGGLTIIDTTLGMADSMRRIEQGISWLGRDLRDIERIILTHAHPDHVGLAKALQDASGAPVVCHPICKAGMEEMTRPDKWVRIAEEMTRHGREPEDVTGERFFTMLMPQRFELIEEGDEVEFAGGRWEVLWTPGHEWGHVAFYRRSDGVLMSGDTLLGKITPHIGYQIEPADTLGQFLQSLDKLATLRAALVIPGHGRIFEDATARAQATKAHHLSRLRRMREILMRQGPTTAMDVAREVFGRNLMFFQERLALAETLAHLEHLRLTGRVRREAQDGLWLYAAPEIYG